MPMAPTPTTKVDTGDLSISAHIRKRLIEGGETLSSAQVVEDYGASNSLLSVLLKAMRAEGHTFEATSLGGGNKGYRFIGMGKAQTNARGDVDGGRKNGSSPRQRQPRKSPLRDRVLVYLEKHSGKILSTEEIMKGTGLTLKQVWQALNSVSKDPRVADRLTKVKRGYYSFAPANLPAVRDEQDQVAEEEDDVDAPLPHPGLYDKLRVQMMGRDEETGTLTIAVRNDEMVWLCEVVGIQQIAPPMRPSRRGQTNGARGRG